MLLLSYVALLGGFSDGVVVAKNLFTGDFWFFQEIYNDIFIRGLSPDGIRTGVPPMYFPDMVLWFALAAIFPPDVVWFLCGFLLNAFGAAGWILVCRRLGAGPLVQGAVPLAYAVQILLLAYGENELFLPAIVLVPIHSGTWSAVPYLLWACLGYSRAKVCLLFGLLTLIAAGDLIIVPWFRRAGLFDDYFAMAEKGHPIEIGSDLVGHFDSGDLAWVRDAPYIRTV